MYRTVLYCKSTVNDQLLYCNNYIFKVSELHLNGQDYIELLVGLLYCTSILYW